MRAPTRVLRLDVASGTFEVFEPYKIPRPNVYDVIPDSRNNGFFLVMGAEEVGRIDAKTGAIEIFKTPTPGLGTAPRHDGRAGSPLVRREPRRQDRHVRHAHRDVPGVEPPTPGAWPYDVTADRNGEVWSGGEYNDRILRLDPDDRSSSSSTCCRRRPTCGASSWTTRRRRSRSGSGSNHGASIVKLEPLDTSMRPSRR